MAYDYIIETGVIVPDTATLLAEVQDEWREALGDDLIVTPDTPQGVLITSEALAREGVTANNAALANQINPNLAGGVFLDAICAFLGLEREGATATRVPQVSLGGIPLTIIPAGTRARDTTGAIFYTAGGVQLSGAGSAVVDMIAEDAGPHAVPIGTLTEVLDQVLGWETVTNALPGIIGNDEQSDDSLRQLRRVTLARQGISTREAQLSAINDLPGVTSAVFRENYTDADATIDGVFLKKHSVWLGVDGGTDEAVAASLLENKTDGADWNGATEVDVVDPTSGQTYAVKFDRAEYVPVFVRVTVRKAGSTADPLIIVPKAIVDYARGELPDEPGLLMGVSVSPFEIGGAVNLVQAGFIVTNVELSLAGEDPLVQTIPITIKQRALIDISYITVLVTP